MTARAPTSAKVGAGVAALLALAGVVVPEVVSAFKPTPAFTALLAVAIGAGTAIGQRVIGLLAQRRDLENALRLWPPKPLGEADLATLGVYPPFEADGKPRPYVKRPRKEDARLRKALTGSDIVVVHGPPGAGKSRAASVAAKTNEVVRDAPAFVPLDPDGLRLVADHAVDVSLAHSRACLWLDGAGRFIEALDPRALASLRALTDRVKIVATIRTDSWNALLNADDQDSEAARVLAAEAKVIELGPLPKVRP